MFEIQMFKRHIAIRTHFKESQEEGCEVEDSSVCPGSHWWHGGASYCSAEGLHLCRRLSSGRECHSTAAGTIKTDDRLKTRDRSDSVQFISSVFCFYPQTKVNYILFYKGQIFTSNMLCGQQVIKVLFWHEGNNRQFRETEQISESTLYLQYFLPALTVLSFSVWTDSRTALQVKFVI